MKRRLLSDSMGFAVAAYVIGLGLFASITPSPLYQGYSDLWGLSPLTLTLVYATYSAGVLITLLFAGRISDQVGRRPVLLVSLAGLLASTVLFIVAPTPAWLFVARGVQGLATGAAISTASSALLDLHPRRDPLRAGLVNGVMSSAGIALGILTAAVLVRLDTLPLVMPYFVLVALLLVALAGAFYMPEPIAVRQRPNFSFQQPRVPAAVRAPFLLAALTTVSTWSLGGLFFSLGPALGARLFDTSDALATSVGIVALGASATASQLLLGRAAPWLGAALGAGAVALGVVVIVVATAAGSGALYLLGSGVAGIGFGVAFLGGLRGLVLVIPAADRASVMSAFYVVAYTALSLPAVLAGLTVGFLGLELTFEAFGAVVVLVAAATGVLAVHSRPAAHAGV